MTTKAEKLRVEKRRETRKERKKTLVEQRGSTCAICNQQYPPNLFDFHHVYPDTKLFGLSVKSMTDHHWQKVLEEANKCLMVCANCHRIIHEKEKQNERTNR